jgi:hypothetical protein
MGINTLAKTNMLPVLVMMHVLLAFREERDLKPNLGKRGVSMRLEPRDSFLILVSGCTAQPEVDHT